MALSKLLVSPYRRLLQRRGVETPPSVLLWWGSYGRAGKPTLGDLLAVDNLSGELTARGHVHAVLSHPELGIAHHQPVPDLFAVKTGLERITFVCGPLLDRAHLRDFLAIHRGAWKSAVGVSILANNAAIANRFDALVPRDGAPLSHFDLAVAGDFDVAVTAPLRRAGLVLRGPQKEYGADRAAEWQRSDALLRDFAMRHSIALVEIDTTLLPGNGPSEIEAAFRSVDLVLTTRMHGGLLALKHGKPAIAVDQVPGGAKVTAVLGKLGWPHVYPAASTSDSTLDAALADLKRSVAAVSQAQKEARTLSMVAVRKAADAVLGLI